MFENFDCQRRLIDQVKSIVEKRTLIHIYCNHRSNYVDFVRLYYFTFKENAIYVLLNIFVFSPILMKWMSVIATSMLAKIITQTESKWGFGYMTNSVILIPAIMGIPRILFNILGNIENDAMTHQNEVGINIGSLLFCLTCGVSNIVLNYPGKYLTLPKFSAIKEIVAVLACMGMIVLLGVSTRITVLSIIGFLLFYFIYGFVSLKVYEIDLKIAEENQYMNLTEEEKEMQEKNLTTDPMATVFQAGEVEEDELLFSNRRESQKLLLRNPKTAAKIEQELEELDGDKDSSPKEVKDEKGDMLSQNESVGGDIGNPPSEQKPEDQRDSVLLGEIEESKTLVGFLLRTFQEVWNGSVQSWENLTLLPMKTFCLLSIPYSSNPLTKNVVTRFLVAFASFAIMITFFGFFSVSLWVVILSSAGLSGAILATELHFSKKMADFLYEVVTLFSAVAWIQIISIFFKDAFSFLAFYFNINYTIFNSLAEGLTESVTAFFISRALVKHGNPMLAYFSIFSAMIFNLSLVFAFYLIRQSYQWNLDFDIFFLNSVEEADLSPIRMIVKYYVPCIMIITVLILFILISSLVKNSFELSRSVSKLLAVLFGLFVLSSITLGTFSPDIDG